MGNHREARARAGFILSYSLAARFLGQPAGNYRLRVVGSKTLSLQSLVTHADPHNNRHANSRLCGGVDVNKHGGEGEDDLT